jgi:uncharacterized sulfatase
VTFTQGHSSASYCRPSLRTLITGLHPVQYAQRKNEIVARKMPEYESYYASLNQADKVAFKQVIDASAMQEFDTLPSLLSTKGYVSWQGGKWWENTYKNGHFTEGMTKGFDVESVRDKDLFLQMMGADGTEIGRTTMQPVFDFIDRKKAQPMFIWYGPLLPHTPFDAPYKFRKFYKDKNISESAKDYYANIAWWDEGVGQLMDHFESHGLLEDTLFIYLSDNGWQQDADVEYKKDIPNFHHDPEYATGGFKGKGALYDMSFRTPVIFYWKDTIRGSFNQTSLVKMEDVVPTILDIAGINIPADLPGMSLKPALINGEQLAERSEIIGFHDRKRTRRTDGSLGGPPKPEDSGFYVRTHRWHYISMANGGKELYDVTVDDRAQNNLIKSYPNLIEGFESKIAAWRERMGMTEWILMD